jgi:hypothetical protein
MLRLCTLNTARQLLKAQFRKPFGFAPLPAPSAILVAGDREWPLYRVEEITPNQVKKAIDNDTRD